MSPEPTIRDQRAPVLKPTQQWLSLALLSVGQIVKVATMFLPMSSSCGCSCYSLYSCWQVLMTRQGPTLTDWCEGRARQVSLCFWDLVFPWQALVPPPLNDVRSAFICSCTLLLCISRWLPHSERSSEWILPDLP